MKDQLLLYPSKIFLPFQTALVSQFLSTSSHAYSCAAYSLNTCSVISSAYVSAVQDDWHKHAINNYRNQHGFHPRYTRFLFLCWSQLRILYLYFTNVGLEGHWLSYVMTASSDFKHNKLSHLSPSYSNNNSTTKIIKIMAKIMV